MSEVSDKFYELLVPKIVAKGYAFKRSKMNFVLQEGEIVSTIDFNWDGRGGTTYLNHISGKIHISYVNKALKTILNYKQPYPIFSKLGNGGHFDESIPQMYSKELVDLANKMAFKNMSEMSFENK